VLCLTSVYFVGNHIYYGSLDNFKDLNKLYLISKAFPMTFNTIAEFLGIAGAGGVVTQIINYMVSQRNSKRDDFEIIITNWKQDNERLREENTRLRERLAHLENEVIEMRAKLVWMENRFFNDKQL
jgi:hypothetical protein